MAFKSYDDLFNAFKQDPKLARHRVKRAEKLGQTVVSSSNSGYPQETGSESEDESSNNRRKAIARRLNKSGKVPRKIDRKMLTAEKVVKRKYGTVAKGSTESKIITPGAEDPIVAKRKKIGY